VEELGEEPGRFAGPRPGTGLALPFGPSRLVPDVRRCCGLLDQPKNRGRLFAEFTSPQGLSSYVAAQNFADTTASAHRIRRTTLRRSHHYPHHPCRPPNGPQGTYVIGDTNPRCGHHQATPQEPQVSPGATVPQPWRRLQ